ncbi:MAG: GIY-YIG nuclease family protein [Bacteroidota bacterium]|nr:GIY-YIG nuclease family protein [Bacteroidota bacterium]
MYYIYLIESIPTGKYYIDQTSDIKSRLKRHNNGYKKYTKPYILWKLIESIQIETRKEAMRLVREIKNSKKRELQRRYFQNNPVS